MLNESMRVDEELSQRSSSQSRNTRSWSQTPIKWAASPERCVSGTDVDSSSRIASEDRRSSGSSFVDPDSLVRPSSQRSREINLTR
jgi:hypothetical protein